MNDQVEKLIAVLESLENHYRQLLLVMNTEKQATLASNPEMMNHVVVRKQELMAALSGLESRRHGLLQQMAAHLRVPVSELNLTTLAQHTQLMSTEKIKQLGRSLADLLAKVQKANDENRALIQHCIELVQNTLGFFQHWLAPVSVYGKRGQYNDGPVSGQLLSGLV